MLTDEEIELAQILWDYHRIDQPPEKVDLIFGLGSYDLRVADRSAELFLEGWAIRIAFSGAEGNFTRGKWPKSEAEMFADRAMELGVPRDSILIEPRATNTGDNVRFLRQLLEERSIEVQSMLLVSKPNMNRRGLATMEKWWPEARVICAHPDTHFLDSPAEGHTPKDIIHEIVGDLQRIIEYPALGYQSTQVLPEHVLSAYRKLIQLGFTQHNIPQG